MAAVAPLGIVYDPASASYDFGDEHPFSPKRVQMVLELLSALGHELPMIAPEPATREQLLTVHAAPYVDAVEALSRPGADTGDAERWGLGTADNPVFPDMDLASRRVVGGTVAAARLVAEGKARRALHLGGGLHHAAHDHASGFCIYNDLAVAIRQLTLRGWNVAYLDIDVHHGDGVQQLFYSDGRVMTVSLHETGRFLFPGTGEIHELGQGVGRGLKVNLPLEPFTEDKSYLEVFDRVVPEALASFRPGILVVQAGADAHFDDPMADLLLTTRCYEQLFRRLIGLADEVTEGRLVVTLGGGYSLRAAPRVWTLLTLLLSGLPLPDELPRAWLERWQAHSEEPLPTTLHDPDSAAEGGLAGRVEGYPEVPRRREIGRHNLATAERLLDATKRYWL